MLARVRGGVLISHVQGSGVGPVPQLLMQLPYAPGHRLTAHHHLQIARIIQVTAQPVAGADPRDPAATVSTLQSFVVEPGRAGAMAV
jgi:hypothetical protein